MGHRDPNGRSSMPLDFDELVSFAEQRHRNAGINQTDTGPLEKHTECNRSSVPSECAISPENIPIVTSEEHEVFPIGTHVEYYSASFGGWIPAVVLAFNGEFGTYQLDVHPNARPANMHVVPAELTQQSQRDQ